MTTFAACIRKNSAAHRGPVDQAFLAFNVVDVDGNVARTPTLVEALLHIVSNRGAELHIHERLGSRDGDEERRGDLVIKRDGNRIRLVSATTSAAHDARHDEVWVAQDQPGHSECEWVTVTGAVVTEFYRDDDEDDV